MRVTAILTQPERKWHDRSVSRTAKRGRVTEVARIRGPVRTHPSGLMNTARRPPHGTLDPQGKSGDIAVSGGLLGECRFKGARMRFVLGNIVLLSLTCSVAMAQTLLVEGDKQLSQKLASIQSITDVGRNFLLVAGIDAVRFSDVQGLASALLNLKGVVEVGEAFAAISKIEACLMRDAILEAIQNDELSRPDYWNSLMRDLDAKC